MRMQRQLTERNKDKWAPMIPENARSSLLWMIGELGEAIEILKKCGEREVMEDREVRNAFVTELADVLMYYSNLCICMGVSAGELSETFVAKHNKNMKRDYYSERRGFLESGQ